MLVQDYLGVPLALENISEFFQPAPADYDVPEFLNEVCDRTGAGIVVDVANVWANSVNFGFDPSAHLERLPLDRVAHAHIAAGHRSTSGFYYDSHAGVIPNEVWSLLRLLVTLVPVPAVIIEYDANVPGADELAELSMRASAICDAGTSGRATARLDERLEPDRVCHRR